MEALEIKLIEKRLSKYSADQLLKKYNENNFSSEVEKEIAKSLLVKRGKLLDGSKVEAKPQFELPMDLSLLEQVTVAIDHLYDKNDPVINKRILDTFDVDIENYDDLTEEQKLAIIDLHTEIFHPDRFVEKKKVETANLKKAVDKVEHKELLPKVVGVKAATTTTAAKPVKEVKEKAVKPVKEKTSDKNEDKNLTIEVSTEGVKAGQSVIFDYKGKKIEGLVTRVLFEHRINKEVCRIKSSDNSVHIKHTKSVNIK